MFKFAIATTLATSIVDATEAMGGPRRGYVPRHGGVRAPPRGIGGPNFGRVARVGGYRAPGTGIRGPPGGIRNLGVAPQGLSLR